MNNEKNIYIRKTIQTDKEELRKIYLEVRQNEFNWVDNALATLTDFDSCTDGEAVFTAIVNNKIAGFISVWEPDKFIHNLFVSKDFRKMGVGKALLNVAVKNYGVPLTLKCVKENTKSVDFYLANGWGIKKEEIGSEGPYYLMTYCK